MIRIRSGKASDVKNEKTRANLLAAKDKKEQEGRPRHRFNYGILLSQLHPKHACEAFVTFWKRVPYFFWTFYIETFLIPTYRPEWATYSKWEVIPDNGMESEVKHKCKKRKKRKKTLQLSTSVPKPVQHNHSQCHIITINVSGKVFETQLRTLDYFPDTLLGDPIRRAMFYDQLHDDFFIDRNRACFDAILYFYQSRGILRRPWNVSMEMFEEEIRFFDLGQDVIDKLRQEEGILIEAEKLIPRRLLQRKYWLLFEYADSSMQAHAVAVLSILVVLLSILLFCLETLDIFQKSQDDLIDLIDDSQTLSDPFFFVETVCMMWFVFEFVIRIITAPKKTVFIKSMSNIIDLLSIIPYFIAVFISSETKSNKASSLTIFRVIRLVRVFRILKLSRHNRGLKVLGKTLRASIRELGLLMFFLAIGVILFSSAVYFAEAQHPQTRFSSILDAFWWSVITMTTCGYGDDVPLTTQGKLVGACCAVAGVLTLALPVPVIVSNFNNFYVREDDSVVAHVETDHVLQCPCRSASYGADGSVLTDTKTPAWNSKVMLWASGDRKPDESDSEFESLRKMDSVASVDKKKMRDANKQENHKKKVFN